MSLHRSPFDWIRFGSIYGLCVLKGFSMLLHNIYDRILLHPGPLTGLVLAGRTDCILKGLRMYVYGNYLQDCVTQQSYTARDYNSGTAAFKRDSKAEALNREKSPSRSVWILITIPGCRIFVGL